MIPTHVCSLLDEAKPSVPSDDLKESGEKPQEKPEASTFEQPCTALARGHLNLLWRGSGWAHRQVGE